MTDRGIADIIQHASDCDWIVSHALMFFIVAGHFVPVEFMGFRLMDFVTTAAQICWIVPYVAMSVFSMLTGNPYEPVSSLSIETSKKLVMVIATEACLILLMASYTKRFFAIPFVILELVAAVAIVFDSRKTTQNPPPSEPGICPQQSREIIQEEEEYQDVFFPQSVDKKDT